ncbi:MAG: ammonium transporter [Nitrospirae bacterium]|nr:MAG: ammonium transporter [Nitrospirota bacterium]
MEHVNIDTGRTAWMLVSTALVLLMVPGLGMFYGGMVRHKNMLNTMLMSIIAMAIVGVEWVVIGYNMAFGTDHFGIIGWTKGGVVLSNIPWDHIMENGVPELVFVMFQGKFAIITPALISGAIVGRVRFSSYVLFMLLWSIFVYNPLAHMVWGSGGYLFEKGVLDFAGGTVVHISAGVSSLVLVLFFLKKRIGYPEDTINPGSLFLTVVGACLLWVGWFGFNAGSAIAVTDIMKRAGIAFTTTQVAAASAALMWALIDLTSHKKITGLGVASGMVAGLVAITPAAGHVSVISAIIIGLLAGFLCYIAVSLKANLGYDDSLDVFGVHGVGGMWGALATGLFVSIGSELPRMKQFILQAQGVVVAIIFASLGTFIIALIVNAITKGLRVSEREETLGLDLSQHGEQGFQLY